jgi:cell division protein FtsI/penicillin-binding protein 2
LPIEEKNILNRLYFIAGGMFLFTLLIAFKIINIQFVDGDKYRALAKRIQLKIGLFLQVEEIFMLMMEAF